MADTRNWNITRGDHFVKTLRVRSAVWNPAANDGAGGWVPGDYKDLTGYTGQFQARIDYDELDAYEGTVTILDQVEVKGGVQYEMPKTETAKFSTREVVYDVEVSDPTGKPKTVVGGRLFVDKDVSR